MFSTLDNRQSYLLLVVIVIIGLLLSYLLYSGPFYPFDDLGYINFSHQLLTGTFNPTQNPYAYGFLLPISIATSFAIFGVSIFTSILPSIIEYIAIILLSFTIARKLCENTAGLISAFLIATAPFVVGYSTRVLPDMGVGALVGISVLFLVYAQSNKSKIFYFFSGAFAAMTIYVKFIGLAYVLALFVVLLIYTFYNKRKTTEQKATNDILIYSFAGILTLAIVYIAIMFTFSGSLFGPFIKYGANQMRISPSNLNMNVNALFTMLFGYSGSKTVGGVQAFPLGLIIFLALAGTIIGFIKKEILFICISVIFWVAFLYIFFGTVTITTYSFIFAAVSRYVIMVSVPMAVLASYALLSIYKASIPVLKNKSIYLPIFILVIAIISYIPSYNILYNYNKSISGDNKVLSNLIHYVKTESHGGNVNLITTSNTSADYLKFLSAYNKSINIYMLNTSSETEIMTQLGSVCLPNPTNTYIIVSYDNYSRLAYTTTVSNLINTVCNVTELESNEYINFYRVN